MSAQEQIVAAGTGKWKRKMDSEALEKDWPRKPPEGSDVHGGYGTWTGQHPSLRPENRVDTADEAIRELRGRVLDLPVAVGPGDVEWMLQRLDRLEAYISGLKAR